MKQTTESFTYCAEVRTITRSGFWMGGGGPAWSSDANVFIPRSQILDADSDLENAVVGEELTIEVPMWLAKDRGLAE